jgi:Chitin binding Peritrophin-A domain
MMGKFNSLSCFSVLLIKILFFLPSGAQVVSFLIVLIVASAVHAGPQTYYRNYKELGCPDFNQHETVHLPHPHSCNQYLTCLSKSVLLQTCPANLHWNIEKNMCDYPDDAQCRDVANDDTVYYNRISRRSRFK